MPDATVAVQIDATIGYDQFGTADTEVTVDADLTVNSLWLTAGAVAGQGDATFLIESDATLTLGVYDTSLASACDTSVWLGDLSASPSSHPTSAAPTPEPISVPTPVPLPVPTPVPLPVPTTGAPTHFWKGAQISNDIEGACAVFAADIDGDGDNDVFSMEFASSGKIRWHENLDGIGTSWSRQAIASGVAKVIAMFAIDLDGDGDVDVLSASLKPNKIEWYENGGSGASWSSHSVYSGDSGARAVCAIDVDGDGDNGVITGSYNDYTVAWLENNGAAGGWSYHEIATNVDPVQDGVVAIDLDGDGDVDVVTDAANGNTIAWHEDDGGSGDSWNYHVISPRRVVRAECLRSTSTATATSMWSRPVSLITRSRGTRTSTALAGAGAITLFPPLARQHFRCLRST